MEILGGKNSLIYRGGVPAVTSDNPFTDTWQLYNDLPSGRFELAVV